MFLFHCFVINIRCIRLGHLQVNKKEDASVNYSSFENLSVQVPTLIDINPLYEISINNNRKFDYFLLHTFTCLTHLSRLMIRRKMPTF